MNILQHVEIIRTKAIEFGEYRQVSEKAGVSFHWLQKFSCGVINNPTVDNVAKLEAFFDQQTIAE